MKENLLEKGHTLFDSFSIMDAQSYWEDEQIDCLLVDLNLSPEGLTDDEIEKTENGLLTGWIWLKEYVLKKNPGMKNKIIIYSDYLPQLAAKVNEEELRGIARIPKRGSESPVQAILDGVDRIARGEHV
jgi:hypothetical protein